GFMHLSDGAALFVHTAREWASSIANSTCRCAALRQIHRRYRVESALPLLQELMTFVATVAPRQLVIKAPDAPELTCDEMLLLNILRAVEANDPDLAYRIAAGTFQGSLSTTLFRIARAYVGHLTDVDLTLAHTRRLRLVSTQTLQATVA
ncbi:MAG: hypothetical protein AAGA84_07625, partial [Pseudomonadota bacterium]